MCLCLIDNVFKELDKETYLFYFLLHQWCLSFCTYIGMLRRCQFLVFVYFFSNPALSVLLKAAVYIFFSEEAGGSVN